MTYTGSKLGFRELQRQGSCFLTDSREGKRSSVDGPILSPPVLHHRRSFNPLWRTTTTTVPEERPGSSLSLLSETSTVRPLPALPSVPSTSTSYAYSEVAKIEVVNTAVDSPPTRLRQRHLPSLSLTLVSGRVTSSTPPRSAEPSFPAFSPRTMQRAHSENPTSGSQFSSLRSHYFTPVSSKAVSTSSSKTTSLANTPGGSSKKSADSDGSASIVRRVSLSDLKIPQRITNAQAKIGRDLKRVKEFKEGVDELKRLRKIYRGLLTSDQTTNRLSCSIDASEHTNDSSEDSSETSASPPPIPTDATARVDNLMARVAIDYQKWWEIADVLINLAEGAEDGQDGDGQGQRNSLSRERCRSEIVVPSIPDAARNGPTDSPLESQVSTAMASSILREKKTINSKNVVQTHSSLSPPSRNLLSTSVQRRAPHLIRSHSTSSLSPQGSSPATPARFTGHNAYTSFSEGITADGQHQSEESSSLSERQLQILRGMLDPHHSRRSPASPISTRSVDSSPARTPSITSISPRSHLFVNGLVPLSPFTSRESNNNRPRSSSSAFSSISASSTSSFVSPLRRRASAKKGHIIIKTVVDSDSRVEENDRLSFRGNSPIPDSPPFHVSNMLPTPMICTIGECTVDLPSNPQNYLITTTNTSPLSSTRRNTTDETPFSKIDNALSILGTSRPSTPPILRKSKFRQASRLGIIGIRDFWKTFNNGNNNSISSTRGNAMEGSTVLPSVEGNDNDALAEPSIIPTEKGNESDCSMVLESVQSENDAREREATASLGKKSRSQEEAVVEEKTQGKDTLSTKMGDGSSDDEDEDWDKRSSDEENNQLPRSDTQATVVPSSLPLQNRGTGDGLSNTASSTSEGVNHRSRTQSATSTASVGTVVHHPSPRMDTLSTGHSNERGSIEFKAGKPNARPTEDSLASSTSTSNPKLALTSEAMPALLAKVMEVKQHCATCVTELR